MDGRLDEGRAFRQKLLAGLIGFLVFGGGSFAVSVYLILHYVLPDARWWQAAHLAFHAIYWSFILGLLGVLIVVVVLDRWHHARGVYRCHRCGATLRNWRIPCECAPPEERASYGPPTLMGQILADLRPGAQRMLAMLPWVLLGYLSLIPVEYAAMQLLRRAPRPEPLWLDWLIGHIALSALVAALCVVVAGALDLLKIAADLRRHLERLAAMFALWPAIEFLAGAALKLLGRL
jgi:hypothetical protein